MADDERDDAVVDPGDPFWALEPVSSGQSDVSGSVDRILYGESGTE